MTAAQGHAGETDRPPVQTPETPAPRPEPRPDPPPEPDPEPDPEPERDPFVPGGDPAPEDE